MQSHQSSFGKDNAAMSNASARRGHERRQSLGKAMPITSLMLNFPPLHRSAYYTRHERSPEHELPPFYFNINEASIPPFTPTSTSTSTSTSQSQTQMKKNEFENDDIEEIEDDFELLVSDCSGSDNDGNDDDDHMPEISLVGNSTFYTPCLTCTNSASTDLASRPSAINEMCRRLCTDECRLRLSLAGFEPPSVAALKSRTALAEHLQEQLYEERETKENPSPSYSKQQISMMPVSEVSEVSEVSAQKQQTRLPPSIEIQRKKFLMEILTPTDSDSDSNFEFSNNTASASSVAAPFTATPADVESVNLLFRDFADRTEIAEALAKTSAMTSTSQIKQRLAARKLEIELDTQAIETPKSCRTTQKTVASTSSNVVNSDADTNVNVNAVLFNKSAAAAIAAAAVNDTLAVGGQYTDAETTVTRTDIVAINKQTGNNVEPPRDLLLYLVRMGSFNSAPKINNIDSQDDGLEIPKGLNTNELLQHVKNLRGDNFPPLITRYFLKSLPFSLSSQLASSDIADGLRYLQLNSVSRACSATVSTFPNHLRLLQWNILSQTLGQNNDGFVRCPEEALTWENRKFLIVQEILQNNPDIVCLQEVDHFKFLQTILGTQNYEGIFFPKPDSPCLYIEENNGPDGCAIFFKRDKFELKSYETRILEVWRVQSNQVAIAANLLVKSLGKEICVCTTHLKARQGALLSKLRNEQGKDLLRFVRNFAGEERPLILCGDFNAEPIEPVYATILSCQKFQFSSAYADIRKSAMEPNESVAVENKNEIETKTGRELETEIETETEAEVENDAEPKDDVEKSILCEPPYTTWKIREDGEECHTIDYVFYAKNKFKILNCLEFPHGDEIGKNRTPSFQYPSDHFSLICDFEILDEPTPSEHDSKLKAH